jgi:hypothetical protein
VEGRALTYSGEGRWSARNFAAKEAADQPAGRDGRRRHDDEVAKGYAA